MSSDATTQQLRSPKRLRYLAAALALISAIVLIPNTANAAYNEDCEPGDTKLLGGDTGTQNVTLLECNFSRAWVPTAVYSAAESKLVIWEPRDAAFDSPLYSQFNPYTGDFNYDRANALYPVATSEKTEFAQLSLTAKALALQSRQNVSTADACQVVPQKFTDDQIRSGKGWLAPTPKPDGSTGTLTYTLASDLTSQQRASVLETLTAYAAIQSGTARPQLVEWASGDTNAPVITFTNGQEQPNFNSLSRNAEAQPVTTTKGRDGLTQWKSGNIAMAETTSLLSPRTVGHELMHVFGYQHTIELGGTTMSPSGNREASGWNLDDANPAKPNKVAFDTCAATALTMAP